MKTNELTGAALDWAVAKCEGTLHDDGTVSDYFQPSVDWEQGGAIIECERISVWARGDEWAAEAFVPNHTGHEETGETPLIAAMRCYVASKLGDEVEVPEELINYA
jgi:hypothetical protein